MTRSNKIKVAIVYPMDPTENKVGGIETFLRNFVKFLPAEFVIKWIGVTANNNTRPTGIWQKIRLGNQEIDFLPVLYVKDENRRSLIPLVFKFVIALIKNTAAIKRQIKNHILFFHRIEAVLPFISWKNKKFLVIHGHPLDYYNQHSEVKWNKFPGMYFLLEKYLIKKFEKIFIVREDAASFYRKRYPDISKNVSFLPTWVDEEVFFPYKNEIRVIKRGEFLKNKGFAADDKLALFVSRFEGQKDPLLLIETFNYVASKLPSVRLLLIGGGGLKDKMESLLNKYGIRERAVFFGVLPQNEIADIMRISDVLVLTSAFEGMPMCVMEALGCGLAVVTTDVGEVKRVVKDGISGRVVFQSKAEIIGEAVLEVIREEKYKDSGNIRMCVKDYSAAGVLRQVYRQMEKNHKE